MRQGFGGSRPPEGACSAAQQCRRAAARALHLPSNPSKAGVLEHSHGPLATRHQYISLSTAAKQAASQHSKLWATDSPGQKCSPACLTIRWWRQQSSIIAVAAAIISTPHWLDGISGTHMLRCSVMAYPTAGPVLQLATQRRHHQRRQQRQWQTGWTFQQQSLHQAHVRQWATAVRQGHCTLQRCTADQLLSRGVGSPESLWVLPSCKGWLPWRPNWHADSMYDNTACQGMSVGWRRVELAAARSSRCGHSSHGVLVVGFVSSTCAWQLHI